MNKPRDILRRGVAVSQLTTFNEEIDIALLSEQRAFGRTEASNGTTANSNGGIGNTALHERIFKVFRRSRELCLRIKSKGTVREAPFIGTPVRVGPLFGAKRKKRIQAYYTWWAVSDGRWRVVV